MNKALNIINNYNLKNKPEFRAPLSLVSNEDNQPRALRSLSQIINNGLCHRCGSCVGICPTNVLSFDKEEYPKIENLSACTDCDLCVKVCPGDEFNYSEHHKSKFENEGELKKTHGHFEQGIIAYSNNPKLRELSTSGGLVSAILLELLEKKEIDGAIVIVSDEKELWKGKPIVARSEEGIYASLKSKYAISPTNAAFKEIREIPGRYAFVGLPCQIHGLEKAKELDKRINERIVVSIGLFCHAAIEHEAFRTIWDNLGDKTQNVEKFVSRIGKHPGAPHLVYKDGTTYPVYFGDKKGFKPSSMEMINILYRLYTPERCLTCFDGLAEFADIAVGDPWMAPPEKDVDFHDGYSFALIRSKKGSEIINKVNEANAITLKELTEKESLSCNKHMVEEKRWRAFRMMETHIRQGKAIPAYGPYGLKLPKHSGKQAIKTEANMLTHMFCFIPKYRQAILKFFLNNGGYILLWINNKRRRLKLFTRDTYVSLKNKLFGRS